MYNFFPNSFSRTKKFQDKQKQLEEEEEEQYDSEDDGNVTTDDSDEEENENVENPTKKNVITKSEDIKEISIQDNFIPTRNDLLKIKKKHLKYLNKLDEVLKNKLITKEEHDDKISQLYYFL